MRARFFLLSCVLVGASVAGCRPEEGRARAEKAAAVAAPAGAKAVTIIGTGELHGTTEPCGCNSDPLGDLARTVALAHGGLLVDAGDALYDPVRSERKQADRKADAINSIYAAAHAEMGVGPDDLPGWWQHPGPPRDACNVTFNPIAAPHVREVAGLRVGIFGAVERARFEQATRRVIWKDLPAPTRDPIADSRAAVAALDKDHPEIVVALLAMKRDEARKLLEAVPGIDFAILGGDVGEGMPEAEPVNGAWLMAPADQGRRVVRLDVVRGGAPSGTRLKVGKWDGESGRARDLLRVDRRVATLKAQLASWKNDQSADPAFVAARQTELDALVVERARTASAKLVPPAAPYFTYTLVPVRRVLPRDPEVAKRLQQLAHDNNVDNFAAAKKQPPPAAAKGQPSFVGMGTCERCHKAAVAFWKKTEHAAAWKTLVGVEKQYDFECIGCHVTGYEAPGGSNLGSVEKQALTNVQCEVCHGPGSRHVAEAGLEDPPSLAKVPASNLCRDRCHTKEHSDTFDLEPYLRDILGPGHGEARRKALGDGPTGHELRQKALAAASGRAG